MAGGNMMVTLTAQTSQFQKGMRQSATAVDKFGKVAGAVGKVGLLAVVTAIGAIANLVPDLIAMGDESRRADLRLQSLAETSGLFGKQTAVVTERMKEFATATMLKTGVDDELIKSAQGILLTFKAVGDSADEVGGIFDRATQAAIDLAAAGFGEVEGNAKQLGKALQDPSKGLTALTRAGVTFTDAEKKRIRTLQESNRLNEAQLLIMQAIESQVGGTAAATVSATDLMRVRFEDMGETIGVALLPVVDALATSFSEFLDRPETKAALDALVTKIQDFATWMNSAEGQQVMTDFFDNVGESVQIMSDNFVEFTEWIASEDGQTTLKNLGSTINGIGDAINWVSEAISNIPLDDWWNFLKIINPVAALVGTDWGKVGAGVATTTQMGVGGNTERGPNRSASGAKVVVNFNAPVDSVSAGREVQRVLNDYARANGGLR